jgi:hypothetical protein
MKTHCSYSALVDPATLKPHPKNPNTHSAAQIAALAAVIEGNGWRAPITVSKRSGLVIRGHGRLEAAMLLGCPQVPVDVQEYASDEEELADMVADNRLSELAELDEDALARVLRDLQSAGHDVQLAGFTEDEVARMLAGEVDTEQVENIPRMELQPFEHYDYLCFMFRDIRDWLRVLQLLHIGKVNYSITRKTPKIGVGRVLDGKRLLNSLEPEHVPSADDQPIQTPLGTAAAADGGPGQLVDPACDHEPGPSRQDHHQPARAARNARRPRGRG